MHRSHFFWLLSFSCISGWPCPNIIIKVIWTKSCYFLPRLVAKDLLYCLFFKPKRRRSFRPKKANSLCCFCFYCSSTFLLCYNSPLEAKDLIGSENVLFYQIVKRWFGRPCFLWPECTITCLGVPTRFLFPYHTFFVL